jgi:hypothetical protein
MKDKSMIIKRHIYFALAIITKDSDNGAQYRCEASNSATTDPLSVTIQLTVHCKQTDH